MGVKSGLKNLKRFLTILLSVALSGSMLGATAFAAEQQEDPAVPENGAETEAVVTDEAEMYTVTLEDPQNGDLNFIDTDDFTAEYSEGEMVTIYATAEEGFELDKIKLNTEEAEEIVVDMVDPTEVVFDMAETAEINGDFAVFYMPAKDVTVSAEFILAEDEEEISEDAEKETADEEEENALDEIMGEPSGEPHEDVAETDLDPAENIDKDSEGSTDDIEAEEAGTDEADEENYGIATFAVTASNSGSTGSSSGSSSSSSSTSSLNGVCKASDGNWYYYKNGVKQTSYTGFASNSNGKWYVENGKVTKKKQGILKDTTGAIGSKNEWYYVIGSKVQTSFTGLSNFSNSSGWWYITNGKVDRSYNGLAKNKNGWYYLTKGKVDRSYTGIATNSNGSWYVKKGKLDRSYNGTYTSGGKTYTIKNGKVTSTSSSSSSSTLNGICKASDGNWYYYKNGVKQTSYTGFGTNSNGKWYVEKGKVTKKTNGVFKDTTGAIGSKNEWYYVVGSKVQTSFTGLANYKNDSGWWYITKGKVDRSYNGLAKNNNGWYYLKNGKVDRSYTGFATNSNGKWYVEEGKVTKKTNGVFKDTTGAIGSKNEWYYVVGSKVQTSFTGLANYKNDSGWWYITKGKVDRSYTGVATNNNGTWYVKDGKVQKSYSGTVTFNGETYTVTNGKATLKTSSDNGQTEGSDAAYTDYFYVGDLSEDVPSSISYGSESNILISGIEAWGAGTGNPSSFESAEAIITFSEPVTVTYISSPDISGATVNVLAQATDNNYTLMTDDNRGEEREVIAVLVEISQIYTADFYVCEDSTCISWDTTGQNPIYGYASGNADIIFAHGSSNYAKADLAGFAQDEPFVITVKNTSEAGGSVSVASSLTVNYLSENTSNARSENICNRCGYVAYDDSAVDILTHCRCDGYSSYGNVHSLFGDRHVKTAETSEKTITLVKR